LFDRTTREEIGFDMALGDQNGRAPEFTTYMKRHIDASRHVRVVLKTRKRRAT